MREPFGVKPFISGRDKEKHFLLMPGAEKQGFDHTHTQFFIDCRAIFHGDYLIGLYTLVRDMKPVQCFIHQKLKLVFVVNRRIRHRFADMDKFIDHTMKTIASKGIDRRKLNNRLESEKGLQLIKEINDILKDAGATDAQIKWGDNLPALSWEKEERM